VEKLTYVAWPSRPCLTYDGHPCPSNAVPNPPRTLIFVPFVILVVNTSPTTTAHGDQNAKSKIQKSPLVHDLHFGR
jgi:hypothetical protein